MNYDKVRRLIQPILSKSKNKEDDEQEIIVHILKQNKVFTDYEILTIAKNKLIDIHRKQVLRDKIIEPTRKYYEISIEKLALRLAIEKLSPEEEETLERYLQNPKNVSYYKLNKVREKLKELL